MNPPGRSPAPRGFGPGLRLRIWVGCLGSALAVALSLWFLIARQPVVAGSLAAEVAWVWLPAIAGGGLLIGLVLALWLDRGIALPLRGLARGIAAGQVAELRGLPSGSGWGELSELVQQVQMLLTRQRQLSRSAAELELLHQQVERMREPLERWARTGRWEPVEPEIGPLRTLALALQRGFARAEARGAETRAASEQVASQRGGALVEAREAAEQAERAFVEATALLTTVRELERLSGELREDQAARGAVPDASRVAAETYASYRLAAAAAIEELISASTASVGHLGNGMLRAAEISDQVHVVANRATLIALEAVAALRAREGGAAPRSDIGEEFKTLAREVRSATDRAAELAREIEADVVAARERMQGVRARVAEVLDGVPEMPAAEAPTEDASRLLDRVREMVQDATLKGERLSAAGERASRSADALVRRLEEETRVIGRLAANLAEETAPAPPATPAPEARSPAAPPPLRLLGRKDLEGGTGEREERR